MGRGDDPTTPLGSSVRWQSSLCRVIKNLHPEFQDRYLLEAVRILNFVRLTDERLSCHFTSWLTVLLPIYAARVARAPICRTRGYVSRGGSAPLPFALITSLTSWPSNKMSLTTQCPKFCLLQPLPQTLRQSSRLL